MRISNKLIVVANFNPTKNTRQDTVETLCQSIDSGELALPLYQRALSWTLDKSVALLNYQLSGKAPVSPISINVIDTETDVPQVSFISRIPLTSVTNSVVDGQQRLTTNYKCWINSPDFKSIVLDLAKGKFVIAKDEIKRHQIPAGVLLNRDNAVLADYIRRNPQFGEMNVQTILLAVRSKMRGYFYTINSGKNLTEDEQIQWFEVLNNAGTRVSRMQLRFSKMKAHGLDVYADYTQKFVEKLESAGFDISYSPMQTDVSYPIAALNPALEKTLYGFHKLSNFAPIPSDTKENQLGKLSIDQLEPLLTDTLNALDEALDFIEDYDLEKNKRIDYILYVIGYLCFAETPDYDYLANWYKSVDFTNRSNTERRDMYSSLLSGYGLEENED